MFNESIANQYIPPTLNQGLIKLIPKPNKDLLTLDNWRPISLLNNDYKVFALIFANRLKNLLDSIIDETQSGFMKNRHITNNIRLVLDILDYPEFSVDDGFIFFLFFLFLRHLIQWSINLFLTHLENMVLETFSLALLKPFTVKATALLNY